MALQLRAVGCGNFLFFQTRVLTAIVPIQAASTIVRNLRMYEPQKDLLVPPEWFNVVIRCSPRVLLRNAISKYGYL